MALFYRVRLRSKGRAIGNVSLLIACTVKSIGEMIRNDGELGRKRYVFLAHSNGARIVRRAIRPLHEAMPLGRRCRKSQSGTLGQTTAGSIHCSALTSRDVHIMINHNLHHMGRRRITKTRIGTEREISTLDGLHFAGRPIAIAERHRLAALPVAARTEIKTAVAVKRQNLGHAATFIADKCRHVKLSIVQLLAGAEHHIKIKTHVVAVIARIDAPCVSGRSRDTMEERHKERDYRHCMFDNRTFHCVSFLWFSVRQSYDKSNDRRCIQQQHILHPAERKRRCRYR